MGIQDRNALGTATLGPQRAREWGEPNLPYASERVTEETPREECCPQLHDQGDKEIWGRGGASRRELSREKMQCECITQ